MKNQQFIVQRKTNLRYTGYWGFAAGELSEFRPYKQIYGSDP